MSADKVATSTQATSEKLPLVPTVWPGAFGAYKFSRQAVALNWVNLLILSIIGVLIGGGQYSIHGSLALAAYTLVYYAITAVVSVSQYVIYLEGAQGRKIEFGDALKKAVEPATIFNMIGLAIIVSTTLFIAFLLLIVPFFILLPRVVLSPYFILDKKMNCVDAFSESWKATKGYSAKVYGIIGAGIAMALLMITIIGIPFAIYFLFMYAAITAVLYEYIKKSGPAKAASPEA